MAAWRAFIPIWLFVASAWAAPPVTTGPESAAIRAPVLYPDSGNAAANLELRRQELEQHRHAALRERELEQARSRDEQQAGYWYWSIWAAIGGALLFAWRNWVSQGTAKLTHLDETFRTYLEQFTGRGKEKGLTVGPAARIGASIGLMNLTRQRYPLGFFGSRWVRWSANPFKLFRVDHPYREDIVRLFVESLATEIEQPILGAVRDRLVEIGQPALQILVDKHREWFAAWMPGMKEPPP